MDIFVKVRSFFGINEKVDVIWIIFVMFFVVRLYYVNFKSSIFEKLLLKIENNICRF